MAYLSGFQNDIFISYAHADNDRGPTGVHWVSEFAGYLATSIRQRLGCGSDLRIFLDSRDLLTNHEVDVLVNEVRNSAIFVAVCSPSYAIREWTRRELETFASVPNHDRRLFAIEMLPLDARDEYPAAIRSKTRSRFWHVKESRSRAALTLDPVLDQQMFVQKLIDLAAQIRDQLRDMRRQGAAVSSSYQPESVRPASAPVVATAAVASADVKAVAPNGTVLLAQATDELELEREQVRAFLQQMNIQTLPDGDYPQGGEAFRAAFLADLKQADMVVQLIGRAIGRRPPDLPEGYVRCQHVAAAASGLPLLTWRHPEISPDALPEGAARDLLTGPTVIASGLENFKSEVLATLDKILRKRRAPERTIPRSLVFLNFDRSDQPIAQTLQRALAEAEFPVVTTTFEGSSEEIRQDLEENLLESESLVFVNGAAPSTWLRSSLRRLHKLMALRETPPRTVAVFDGPPSDKADPGFSLPYVETVDSRDGVHFEPLIELLKGAT